MDRVNKCNLSIQSTCRMQISVRVFRGKEINPSFEPLNRASIFHQISKFTHHGPFSQEASAIFQALKRLSAIWAESSLSVYRATRCAVPTEREIISIILLPPPPLTASFEANMPHPVSSGFELILSDVVPVRKI